MRLILNLLCGVLPFVAFVGSVHAATVVTCKDPKGYANLHHYGVLKKEGSGYAEDAITGGLTTLVTNEKGQFDLLFTDVRKQIISTKSDGGEVVLLRKGKNDATFMLYYPGMVIELYTFYRDNDGKEWYDLLQSKGGDKMPIHKSAVLTGTCTGLNLSLLP